MVERRASALKCFVAMLDGRVELDFSCSVYCTPLRGVVFDYLNFIRTQKALQCIRGAAAGGILNLRFNRVVLKFRKHIFVSLQS